MGDPAEIKAKRVKKQKFDREDARLILRLMRENNFPQVWVPGPENRDLRQLLWHRHRLVQMRTRIMNQLHALAMNEGYRWKKKLFSEQGRAQLEKLTLAPWASRRRQELLELLDRMNQRLRINRSRRTGSQEATRGDAADDSSWRGSAYGTRLRVDHRNSDSVSTRQADRTYVGMIPCEESSARKQRLGHISKQGIPCCASCWWKQPKQRPVSIRTGDVGIFTWRCVDTKVLPR